ncbi:MAG: exopolysaccharide biosynthesis polyprenyl glycosylphosphotransferase [Candidatus Omnitrophica bacterium]|nr:exopolysaccharide biosynthesis polyprenyl glycosylphosphotransferase [Candidatus Omnitrophota bacterium]
MIKARKKIYPIYLFVDVVIIALSFILPYLVRYNSPSDIFNDIYLPNVRDYSFVFILWTIFIVISFKRRNLYATDRALNIPQETSRVVISVCYTAVLIGTIIFFAQFKFFSRLVFLSSFLSLVFFLSLWRIIKRLILRKLIAGGYHNINVLIIGVGRVGKIILEEIKKNPWGGLKVIGFLDDNVETGYGGVPVLGKLSDFPVIAKKYFVDEVIVTIPSEKIAVSEIIRRAKEMHLGVKVVPENFEEPLPVLDISHLGVIPLLTYKERKHHPAEFFIKRLMDLVLSFILLIFSLPIFLLIAILIKMDSKGPVFYRQKRVGFKGRTFNFYKFRSMVAGADKRRDELVERNEVKDGVIFKIREDPRITSVGKFLRRHSLDELPQLFNVLLGDMSLVGPRPPLADEVEKYSHIHMQRLSIRPGMTGLSQVRGRSELTFTRWVKWDLWYINNWSLGLDMQILWRTIPAVIRGEGAY